jgi:hypothetical protein
MSTVELLNPHLRVVVAAGHGAEVVHLGPAGGPNFLFHSDALTPLPASASRTYGNPTLDWLSEYRGGWQELWPNAGGACEVLGVPLPFHGEASRAQWRWQWRKEGTHVTLATAARLPIVLEREMRLDDARPVLKIEERVRCEAGFEVPYVWGHHPAWGAPLAEPGARIDLPGRRVVAEATMDGPVVDLAPGSEHSWPLATTRDGQPVDLSVVPGAPLQRLAYVSDLSAGWYAIRNPRNGYGLAAAWDLAVMPCVWLWQEIEGGQGMPWYGRWSLTAIEPNAQWPSYGLVDAMQRGMARAVQPGETHTFHMTLALFEAGEAPVTGVDLDGNIRFAA